MECNLSSLINTGTSYIDFASIDSITESLRTLQNRANLFLRSLFILCSLLQTNISGWIPASNNFLTEC